VVERRTESEMREHGNVKRKDKRWGDAKRKDGEIRRRRDKETRKSTPGVLTATGEVDESLLNISSDQLYANPVTHVEAVEPAH